MRTTYQFLSLTATVLFAFGCQDVNDTILPSSEVSSVSWEQAERIGELHNEYLAYAMNGIEHSSESAVPDLEANATRLSDSLELGTFPLQTPCGNDCIQQFVGEGYAIISDLQEAADGAYSVSEINTLVAAEVEETNRSRLSADQKATILIYLSVYAHSAEFWLETELGGLGYADLYSVEGVETPLGSRSGYTVLASDGAAAAGGFISGAAFCAYTAAAKVASGGIGVGIFFGRIAAGAAFSSGYAFLTQCA